ncbi:MAG TPA: protein-methionine-sulfoxide reductase catalytic subunit MsrP [Rhodospirillales bacterium]|nr:protein-methionine-sulfoxide reductase catalytic subunit MsrP [Rhodospirillales bacterium]
MLIKIRKPSDVRSSEITPKEVFLGRRRFIQGAGLAAAGVLFPFGSADAGAALPGVVKSPYTVDQEPTPLEFVTTYNNFYEFGTGKDDPAKNARKFNPKPWSVAVSGEVSKPGVYALEDLIKPHQLEERVYRLRCVEAWSMVVPWVGIPLADVLKRFEPTPGAKFVAFETLFDPERMPGQRRPVLKWPYIEALRMDEAMHPLAILAVGLYGEELPNQNGAPIRLITPWKYGFKSIKSIVSIRLMETMPPTTWNRSGPGEYGFYANVNPNVDHPRWSQKKERRIGDSYFAPKKKTLMFNGYEDEVAGLYAGMDLKKFF